MIICALRIGLDILGEAMVQFRVSLTRVINPYQAGLTPLLSADPPVITRYGIFWSGGAKLQRASSVSGIYSTLSVAVSPYQESVSSGASAFFRLTE